MVTPMQRAGAFYAMPGPRAARMPSFRHEEPAQRVAQPRQDGSAVVEVSVERGGVREYAAWCDGTQRTDHGPLLAKLARRGP